jgi:hypothetical protein
MMHGALGVKTVASWEVKPGQVLGGSGSVLAWSGDVGSVYGVVLNECAGCAAGLCG